MPSYSLLLGVGTILSSLSGQAVAAVYEQQEKFSASNWLDAFHFETYELTNGYVDYVDQDVAENLGLYKADGEDIIFGADSHEKLDPSDDNIFGRKSVRLEGNTDYNHGLFVIDIQHMPTACGMWPAFWSLGREPWPVKGEIDIVEGVNANTRNKYVLHTDTDCKVDGQGQSYPQLNNDCALDGANGAAGCDVDDGRTNSFGKGFNDNHGGYYVMEWASDAIKTWFFPRGSQLPASLTGTAPDTSEFGQPAANFKGDCNIEERFKDQRFIFTNTFCGDWAGNAYASSSCPKYKGPNGETLDSVSMCKKHVAEHPEDFMEAYWKVSSFRTFTKRTLVSSSSVAPSSTPVSSSVHVSSTEVHVDSASSSAPHVDATSSSVHYSATASSAPHVDATSSSVHHDASASPSVHYDASSSSVYHDASASPSVHYDASASSSVYYATNTPAVSSVYDSHHDYPAESSYPAHPSSSGKPYGVYPAGNSSAPYHHGTAYGTGYAASSAKPDYHTYNEPYGNAAKSTPCSTSSAKKAYQTDVYAVYPDSKSSAVVYGEYNAKPSKPVKNDYPYLPDFTPVSPIYPDVTSKPSYGNDYGYDSYPEGSKTVYTTTYTTSYVDVCETGYTTIKTTHVVTYTATATPAAHPTPGNDYPVYPPPGFEITTKVCNKGCGEGSKTVTVTLPCDKCGYYPSEETGKIVTPIPAMPTQPAEDYNTIYSKVYSTKVITLSKIVVHQSEYPAQHQSAPVYGEDKPTKPTHAEEVPSHPVYTPVHGQPGKPVMPSSGYGYPAKNGTTTYATGAVKPSASMTGYNTPEFTGAASSFKAGGMVAAAAFAALLL